MWKLLQHIDYSRSPHNFKYIYTRKKKYLTTSHNTLNNGIREKKFKYNLKVFFTNAFCNEEHGSII